MQRRHDEAQALFDESLPVLMRVSRLTAMELHAERAVVDLIQGRHDAAAAALEAAQALHAELCRSGEDAFLRYIAGLRRWAGGDRDGARASFAEAAARSSPPNTRTRGTILALLAAAGAGPTLRAELAAARDEGALPDLIMVLEAWAAGEQLPPPPEWESTDAQLARLLVGGAAPWRMDADGRWFERPNGRVDLSRRGPMRRILAALLAARRERPGSGLTVDDLFAAGWPAESAQPEAASARVYTAIRELRALGLEPVLCRRAEGYLLDPEFSLAIA